MSSEQNWGVMLQLFLAVIGSLFCFVALSKVISFAVFWFMPREINVKILLTC